MEAGDFDALPTLCAEDVVFRSPIAHKPYHGRETLGAILRAVSRVFEDLTYIREIGGGESPDSALVSSRRSGVWRSTAATSCSHQLQRSMTNSP